MSINRYDLVYRHNPALKRFDPSSPLTVGNGEFAFTADATGLQSFPEEYENTIPLCTMSQWGWHTHPREGRLGDEELRLKSYDTYGREVGYPTSKSGQEELFDWLRENPHRLHLGRIGLRMTMPDGRRARISDVHCITQTLDLWRGLLVSRFAVDGTAVAVQTCCHPALDILAVSIDSLLIGEGRLEVEVEFPYGSGHMTAADWMQPERHMTEVIGLDRRRMELMRVLDDDRYFVEIESSDSIVMEREGKHSFAFRRSDGSTRLELVFSFSQSPARGSLPTCAAVFEESAAHWSQFWIEGAAIELAESSDERALELERRIVLSQYLTAIQCAGSLPPQETGLTCNSWFGKYHLEMHWWHAAHFALWGRVHLLERSLWWYKAIMPRARRWAESQGYTGARWPKMVGPDGVDSPSPIGPLLIWQQPHPIMYAELCYRAHPERATLELYRDIVFATAEFMASFAVYDAKRERYVLGPPVIPAQENHRPTETFNPTFELAYWAYGLGVAQQWRERLGMAREPLWDRVVSMLSPLPEREGVYLAHENCPNTFTEFNYDHPSMLAALGVLPGAGVDLSTMRRTLHRVLSDWQWDRTWGWDYPMVAMTAARLGEPDVAIDTLLMDTPKNRYLPNGHNWQRPNLPLYLPGNGGLLTATAMMAAGWDGSPDTHAPGFPRDGKWKVSYEGIQRYV